MSNEKANVAHPAQLSAFDTEKERDFTCTHRDKFLKKPNVCLKDNSYFLKKVIANIEKRRKRIKNYSAFMKACIASKFY